ncbi:MAG: nitronate monooxygenase [Salibacteraceae bacterium]|jgi:nitronate monooxygenase
MNVHTPINQLLEIDFPMIMAPMFLVSNEDMMKAGIDSGVMATFPTLNYRTEEELAQVIQNLHAYKKDKSGNFGVNLIAQKSNPFFEKHLKVCADNKVPFYITSLGNPKKVIALAHSYGAKVFCDVVNIEHAQKVYDLGCDGFIAVGQGAGGHSGPNPLQILVRALKQKFDTPVIAAGGVADGWGMASMLALGAEAVSVGTAFIATEEASVNDGYKNAIVDANMEDIVMSNKISGSWATVINTPYAKKIGHKQNFFERSLSSNSVTKKYFKMWIQISGMKKLEKSVKPGNYKTLWIAGKSSALIHKVAPVKVIIDRYKTELNLALQALKEFQIPANLKL